MNLKSVSTLMILLPFKLFSQTEDSAAKEWTGTIEADYYFIPVDYVHPTLAVYSDHNKLHLESRFNYEDFNTVSVYAGYNFDKEGDVSLTVTPMLGVAVGQSNGVLPGLECTAAYANINFYSENEYMFDFRGKEDDFFYSWTQLSTNVIKNIQAGLSTETIRLYQTKFDVQKGIYIEYAPGKFLFDVYYFNPLSSYNYVVASVSFNF